jgi:hypothetical protein
MNAKIIAVTKKIASIAGRIVVAPFVLASCYLVFVGLVGGLFALAFWDAGIIVSAAQAWTTPASVGVGFLRLFGWAAAIFLTYGFMGPRRS